MQIVYLARISFWPPVAKGVKSTDSGSVTVLVCARNEEDHIDILLRALVRQSYSNFQVFIVNDQSTDGTVQRVRNWQEKHPDRIQLFSLMEKQYEGKKGAIWEAVPHIKSDYILFTDADCRPVSDQWIARMVAGFAEGADIVVGYSPVLKTKGWVNLLQRVQNAWTAWQYLGAAFRRRPYMVVGRNWAVKRKFYQHHQNIEDHGGIPSGDDDLVLQSLVKEGKSAVQVHPESWVLNWQAADFQKWWQQRLRHLEAGFHYPLSTQLLLLACPIGVALTLVIACCFLAINFYVGVALLVAQWAVWVLFGRHVLRRLGREELVVKFPFLLPVELAFQGMVFLLTLSGKKGRWK